MPGSPTPSSVLSVLAKARLIELGRDLAVALPTSATKDQQIERLTRAAGLDLPAIARLLSRDELKQACRAHGLDDGGRAPTRSRRRTFTSPSTSRCSRRFT